VRILASIHVRREALTLVVEVLGLVFIGLVSAAGFSVMAQRRLRALRMLSAIGATERNLRVVMIAGGAAVGMLLAGREPEVIGSRWTDAGLVKG
jgi:hypothetical protein